MRHCLAISITMVALLTATVAIAQQSKNPQSNADCQPGKVQGGTVQFLVTKVRTGYSLLLPPDLLRKFPQSAQYEISLFDKKKSKATIVGAGTKNGENFQNIKTRQSFKLASIARDNLQAIHISGSGPDASTQSEVCRGCERDPFHLENYDTDHTICFCEIKKGR
jgi:hypothetical protein